MAGNLARRRHAGSRRRIRPAPCHRALPERQAPGQPIQVLTTGSPRFAELWASGAVSAHREDHKIVEHPAVGPIAVDCDILTDRDAELKIVILTAAPDTEDETKLRLAFLSGVPHPARG